MRSGTVFTRLCRVSLIGAVVACSSSARHATVDVPVVSTLDVHRFLEAAGHIPADDSMCAPFGRYLREGSAGLAAYAHKFSVGRAELCAALHQRPIRYAALDTLVPALDAAAKRIGALLARFQSISPTAQMPDVYVVVGSGISGGTTVRGRSPMILVGAELMRSAARLPRTVAHELAHTQQQYPWWGMLTGGPSFLRATVLRQSLTEGVADVVAEVLTGEPKRNAYGEAHEAALWTEFQRDMHSHDYGAWLYNGRNLPAGSDRPGDLGYWMGYRIAKAYYDRIPDKSRAMRDLLTIRDFDAFLQASGYRGGA